VPYVADWGEDGALEAVTAYAKTIDELARRLEDAVGLGGRLGDTEADTRPRADEQSRAPLARH
jgi:hypothetical protein